MFDSLRKKASGKNLLAYIIFGAICLVFALLGLAPNLAGISAGGAVAEVNDQIISIAQLRSEVQRLEGFFGGQMGGAALNAQRQQLLRNQALNQLINHELVVQNSEALGVWVTDKEVRERIVKAPYFQRDGRFASDVYRQILASNNLTPGDFEKMERKRTLDQKARSVFTDLVNVIPVELEKEKLVDAEKIKVAYLKFEQKDLADPKKVSQNQVKAFLKNAEGKQEVEKTYESQKQNFNVPEQVRVRQIMIAAKKGDEESEKKAVEKINKIKAEAEKGDFAALAKKHDEDPATKSRGGDLGFFSRGRLEKNFENVLFSLKPDEIKGPIRSPNGYHLLKLLEKREARQASFDEVKDQIAKKLLGEKKAKSGLEQMDNVLSQGKVKGVDSWAKEMQLAWLETDFIGLGQEDIPGIEVGGDEFVKTAFGLGQNTPVAKKSLRAGKSYYVLKFMEKPAAKKQPEEGADGRYLESQISRQRANDAFSRWLISVRNDSSIRVSPTNQ